MLLVMIVEDHYEVDDDVDHDGDAVMTVTPTTMAYMATMPTEIMMMFMRRLGSLMITMGLIIVGCS